LFFEILKPIHYNDKNFRLGITEPNGEKNLIQFLFQILEFNFRTNNLETF